MTRGDYGDIATMLQTIISPLTSKLQTLEDKVDKLSQDRVTRSDIEKLRGELVGTMVPRDAYEPRHASLVERDMQLENISREERKDRIDQIKSLGNEMQLDLQRIHERLESGKQQLEERIKEQH